MHQTYLALACYTRHRHPLYRYHLPRPNPLYLVGHPDLRLYYSRHLSWSPYQLNYLPLLDIFRLLRRGFASHGMPFDDAFSGVW
jgi:hypothetical protein